MRATSRRIGQAHGADDQRRTHYNDGLHQWVMVVDRMGRPGLGNCQSRRHEDHHHRSTNQQHLSSVHHYSPNFVCFLLESLLRASSKNIMANDFRRATQNREKTLGGGAVNKCRLSSVAFRSAKEHLFRGAKGDTPQSGVCRGDCSMPSNRISRGSSVIETPSAVPFRTFRERTAC